MVQRQSFLFLVCVYVSWICESCYIILGIVGLTATSHILLVRHEL